MHNELIDSIYESIDIKVPNNSDEMLYEAEFKFLPKFNHDHIPKQLLAEMEASNRLLANEGITDKVTAEKVLRIVFRAFSIIDNVYGCLLFPALLVPVIGWIYYLCNRLWVWAWDSAEEYFMKKETLKIIAKLSKIKKETQSKEVRRSCEQKIDSLNDKLKKMNESSYDFVDESFDDFDLFF